MGVSLLITLHCQAGAARARVAAEATAATLTDDGDDVGLGEEAGGEWVGGEALGRGLGGVGGLGHVMGELCRGHPSPARPLAHHRRP